MNPDESGSAMLAYRYRALNSKGRPVTGIIFAHSEPEALFKLSNRDYEKVEIRCTGEKFSLRAIIREFISNLFFRVGDQTLIVFTKELALMLRVGISINSAFQLLAGYQEDEKMRKIIESLGTSIRTGSTVSRALLKYPGVFSPLYHALVEIGETSGQLPRMLEELSGYQEKEFKTKRQIISALTYPVFVMGSTIIILSVLMAYYVPSFVKFLVDMRVELPFTTRILVAATHLIQNPAVVISTIISFLILCFLYRNYGKTIVGRFYIDSIKMKIPVVGEIIILSDLTRFARAFALMYRCGVQVSDIMEASKDVVQIEPIKEVLRECNVEIFNGESFSRSLGDKKHIPPLMKSFLFLGEETGDMVTSMEKVSEIYDGQISYRIECLISLLEPLFMAFVASFVGFVGLSLFLPIYSVISNMGA